MEKTQKTDSSLVQVAEPPNFKWWIMAFGSSCALIFAVYLAIGSANKDKSRPPFTTADGQRQKVVKYQKDHGLEIVMVGSSLSQHFRSEYFKNLDIYNLSLSGGSAMSGLEIIANSRCKPKFILIESNLIYRDADQELVADFSSYNPILDEARFLVKDFQPIKTLLANLLNKGQNPDVMLKNPETIADEIESYRLRAEVLLSQLPGKSADQARQIERFNEDEKINFEEPTKCNLERILEIADGLSNEGVQVIFYELPFPDLVMGAKFSEGVRQIIQNRLASSSIPPLITFSIDENKLSWPDAHHLDERSSIIVGRDLERQVKQHLRNKIVVDIPVAG